MMRIHALALALVALTSPAGAADLGTGETLAIPPLPAPHHSFSFGPDFSTLGFGFEAGYRATPLFGMRAGMNYLPFDYSIEIDELDYDLDATLFSAGVTGDYYPFRNGFRLSAGVLLNGNEGDLFVSPDPAVTFTLGDTTYTGAEIGDAEVDVDFNTVAPYVGFGYEHGISKRFQLSFDIGAIWQGDPDVALTIEDPFITVDPEDVESHRQEIEEELELLEFYPVVKFSAQYRF